MKTVYSKGQKAFRLGELVSLDELWLTPGENSSSILPRHGFRNNRCLCAFGWLALSRNSVLRLFTESSPMFNFGEYAMISKAQCVELIISRVPEFGQAW